MTVDSPRYDSVTLLLARLAGSSGVLAVISASVLFLAPDVVVHEPGTSGHSYRLGSLHHTCLDASLVCTPFALLVGLVALLRTRWRGPVTAWLGLGLGVFVAVAFCMLIAVAVKHRS